MIIDSIGNKKLEDLGRLKEDVFFQTTDIGCLCVKAMTLAESMVEARGSVCRRGKERS